MDQVHLEDRARLERPSAARKVIPTVAAASDLDHDILRSAGGAAHRGFNPALARSILSLQRWFGNRATSSLITAATAAQRHAEPSVIAAGPAVAEAAGTASATTAAASPPAAAPAPPTQDAKEKAAKPFLEASDEGKAALDTMTKRKVKVDWLYTGSGSFFDGGENGVHINKAENAPSAALIFVHEMNHAEYFHSSKTADVDKLDRAAYVKAMIDEEAEGTVKSIVAKIEMEGGLQVCLNASFVMEKEYAVAYKNAIDELVKKKPTATEQEKKANGRQAGLKRVNDGFYDGTIVTSTTGESYAVYYGKYWDKVHAPPAAATPVPASPVGVAGGF